MRLSGWGRVTSPSSPPTATPKLTRLSPFLRPSGQHLLNSINVVLHRRPCDHLADDIQGHVLKLLEAHTRFSHVELLPARLPSLPEPFLGGRVAIHVHKVNRHVVLLRAETGQGQW